MNHKSFTLIEILVVIVVIGILSSFILVGMSSITNSANVAKGKAFSESLRNSLLMDLVSEFKFEDNVNDSWGSITGSLFGTPVYKSGNDCVSNKCLDFNGGGDYFTLSSVIFLSAEFTISIWANRDTNNSYDMITGRTGDDRKIGLNNGNNKIFVRVLAGGTADASTSDDVVINKWNHVVITRNSYNKIDSRVNAGAIRRMIGDVAQVGNFEISMIANDSSNLYFDGKLDTISIYDKQMPVSLINSLYYSGLNKLLVSSNINIQEFDQRLSEFSGSLADN